MTELDIDLVELHRRATDAFGQRVHAVEGADWGRPTPCPGWDVRALVQHVVGENRWTPPLLAGRTIAEVGDRFEGDLLGDVPAASWDDSARKALEAVGRDGALLATAHLSFGDVPGEVYVSQLFADFLVHAWDLARATGGDERLDPELVAACGRWFDTCEDDYRAAGAVGPRVEVGADADPQTQLLARFGRQA